MTAPGEGRCGERRSAGILFFSRHEITARWITTLKAGQLSSCRTDLKNQGTRIPGDRRFWAVARGWHLSGKKTGQEHGPASADNAGIGRPFAVARLPESGSCLGTERQMVRDFGNVRVFLERERAKNQAKTEEKKYRTAIS